MLGAGGIVAGAGAWGSVLLHLPAAAPLVINSHAAPLALLALPLVALGCGAILLGALATGPGSWLAHPGLVALGRISYGLYIWHVAALHVMAPLPWPWRLVLGFALTAAVAALSYRYLERPFLRLKGRFTYVPSSPIGASVAVAP